MGFPAVVMLPTTRQPDNTRPPDPPQLTPPRPPTMRAPIKFGLIINLAGLSAYDYYAHFVLPSRKVIAAGPGVEAVALPDPALIDGWGSAGLFATLSKSHPPCQCATTIAAATLLAPPQCHRRHLHINYPQMPRFPVGPSSPSV